MTNDRYVVATLLVESPIIGRGERCYLFRIGADESSEEYVRELAEDFDATVVRVVGLNDFCTCEDVFELMQI